MTLIDNEEDLDDSGSIWNLDAHPSEWSDIAICGKLGVVVLKGLYCLSINS